MADELSERLFSLYPSLSRAHGRYTPTGGKPGEKVGGRANTVRQTPTPDLWEQHLAGNYGLGLVPIREDSTAQWGAIDVDVYVGLDHKNMVNDVLRLRLPLVVCRTKSGGAHLYLFLSEPATAELVRTKLMEWAVALGYSGVEVFPKQIRLSDNEHDMGNWINMPYFGGDHTTRYAVDKEGDALTVGQFIEEAERRRVNVETLREINPVLDEAVTELLEEAPPCIQSLAIHGFGRGERNNSMFNLAVYLKKRYPDNNEWEEHLEGYNERFMAEALTHKEVVAIRNSLRKKTYGYKCNDPPICNACNKQICLTRKHGVGGAPDDPGVVFGDLIQVRTEPEVSYIWDVDGVRVSFGSAKQILDQRAFQLTVMDAIRKVPNFIEEKSWRSIVRQALEKAEVVVPPEDATPTGQLREHLNAFLTTNAQAKELDELLLGYPFTDAGTSYFRLKDFITHLQRHRFGRVNERDLFTWLRKIGAKDKRTQLKGRQTRYWLVKAPDTQTEDFNVPIEDLSEIDEHD